MSVLPLISLPLPAPLQWATLPIGALPRRTSGPDGELVFLWLAVAAVLIAAVCGVCYLVNRMVHCRRHYSHAALFGQLCRLHGLDAGSRRLLKRLAGQHNLPQPAKLFVDPRWLDSAAAGGTPPNRRAELTALRHRLFGPPQRDPEHGPADSNAAGP